ncbi:hypothetical protein WMY93_021827 [Mugilogobius chulae]|uniref:Phosphatidic acid phosphatase type 2/haloperoxidase domain-containing protein n=1 Tax=Mugilogobius chulae TaxID=88201 RepID=A0AAW0NGR1_9GOBI
MDFGSTAPGRRRSASFRLGQAVVGPLCAGGRCFASYARDSEREIAFLDDICSWQLLKDANVPEAWTLPHISSSGTDPLVCASAIGYKPVVSGREAENMFEASGVLFVLLDLVCLVLAFNLGKVRPYQRGFFCSDESIMYPFHDSTVTSTVLYSVGFTLPISCMIIGECLLVYFKKLQPKSSFGCYVACIYKAVGTFLFGAAMSQSLTDIAKYSIGRLRPHFLDICKPDWKASAALQGLTSRTSPAPETQGRSRRAGYRFTQATPLFPCTACCFSLCISRLGSSSSDGRGCSDRCCSFSSSQRRFLQVCPECRIINTTGAMCWWDSCRGAHGNTSGLFCLRFLQTC